ncbi:hypothetical protein F5Y03DRAFT_323106 [Xylaria venustula]|nr:hypothetical protein F5Y03DRAFT_323106 [Xylaria venustula]
MDTNMEYVDPQLLFDTSHLTESSTELEQQAEFSFSEYLQGDTDNTMAQQYPIYTDFEVYSPFSELPAFETYPEAPVMPAQPDPQPGSGTGYYLDPQFPIQPMFTPVQSPRPQYRDAATQTVQRAPRPKRISIPERQAGRYSFRSQDQARHSEAPANERQHISRTKARAKSNGQSIKTRKELTKPLSKLAPEMPGYKALDMEAFVRRSTDCRIMRGKIGRPLNAFILYRKAFGDVARSLAAAKHTEVHRISQMIGASWRMEAQEVRDYFNRLAAEEKAQHMLRFPDYVFTVRNMAVYPLPSTPEQSDDVFGEFKNDEDEL